MEVKELMVNDWMQHANGKYYQVKRVDCLADNRVHFACDTPHLWEYNNKFYPIPLTDEILKKNGFEKIDGVDALFQEYGHPWVCWDGKFLSITDQLDTQMEDVETPHILLDVKVEYVHQLQHALRMVGVEKEIVLS